MRKPFKKEKRNLWLILEVVCFPVLLSRTQYLLLSLHSLTDTFFFNFFGSI